MHTGYSGFTALQLSLNAGQTQQGLHPYDNDIANISWFLKVGWLLSVRVQSHVPIPMC